MRSSWLSSVPTITCAAFSLRACSSAATSAGVPSRPADPTLVRRSPDALTTPMSTPMNTDAVRSYLLGLQDRIVAAFEAEDGTPFVRDAWTRAPGERLQGDGCSRLVEDGQVLERGGCPFEAMGVSLVFHPRNPYAPTVHMNVRMLAAHKPDGTVVAWFGGGMDLTPSYGFAEDAVHFHQVCKDALAPFGDDKYPRFKTWCDEYFFLKHRNEARGIGGIFFDDFSELSFDGGFAMIRSVGDAFTEAYLPILQRRRAQPYGARERDFQP